MKRTSTFLAACTVLAVLTVASCSQNPVGIFASIARERLIIDDRTLANDLTVGAFTKAGSRYFMASGLLRWREAVDADIVSGDVSEWATITSPGVSSDNYITTSVVEFLGDIFVSYVHQSGSPSGVYVITDPAATSPTLSSSPVVDSVTAGIGAVGELFVVDDNGTPTLLVSARQDTGVEYQLYASTDGTTFSPVTGTDGVGSAWTDVASDGTNLLYLNASTVLVDAGGINAGAAPVAPAGSTGKTGSAAWRGAHFDGTSLWLSDNSGYLYSSADFGGTWTKNAEAYRYEGDADEAPIAFTDFATINNTVADVTVVGTEALGYYVLGANASVAPATPAVTGSNYRESGLSALAVNTFYVDTTPQSSYPVPTPSGNPYELLDGHLLFVGTANGGLWRALFHDGATQWVQE